MTVHWWPRVLLIALSAALIGAGPAGPAAGVPAEESVGVWPLTPVPEVVERFNPPATPYGAGHRGVDLLGSVGQPVRTALAGTVGFAGSLAGRGVVVVDHGATRTTYEPVAASVGVGDSVAAGAVIGTLQSAPSHCAPRACLHWGWLEGSTYLDPLLLVGAGPVRLLPLASSPMPGPSARALGWSLLVLPPMWLPFMPWLPVTPDRVRPAGVPGDRPRATGPW